jgi:hypothetical protein
LIAIKVREKKRVREIECAHISALASYKLMWKETQLHLKVLSPEESGNDNYYNGRWTFFINDIEYFSQLCSEYWLHIPVIPSEIVPSTPFSISSRM